MKRSRMGLEAPAAGPKPVLGLSSRMNQVQQSAAASMSYKELIKVVGVDCETGPSSWRKAIDHSAETVVFFQVDLRGAVPRMAKSVRIVREEGTGENKGVCIVPSVYVGDTLLSSTYVKTIIGRRFLADEDDLMKLLEHAGILQEDQEITEEKYEDTMPDDWGVETEENYPSVEPEPKKAKTADKSQVASGAGLRPQRTRGRPAKVRENVPLPSHSASEVRPTIDLTPMLLFDSTGDNVPSSSRSKSCASQEEMSMERDFDVPGLPAEDDDDLPLGFDTATLSDQHEQETVHHAETEQDAANEPAGYRFPFQIRSSNKELLIEGFDSCAVWIEKGRKSFLETELATKPKSEGTYIASLCRAIIRDKDACGVREMQKRAEKLRQGGAKSAGIQQIFGADFLEVMRAYVGHVGFPSNSDSVTRAMNAWKKREFEHLKKGTASGKK